NNNNNNNNNNNAKNQNVKYNHPVDSTAAAARCVVPQNIPLTVLFEDDDMLVIDKPSGMIMQFVPDSLENAVVFHLLNSTTASNNNFKSNVTLGGGGRHLYKSPESWPWKSQDSFEGIVHRLDQGTSGIVVVAKHPVAAAELHASFKERRVHKTYLAIAVGLPTNEKLQANTIATRGATRMTPQQNHLLTTVTTTPSLQRLSREIKKCGRNATKALELLTTNQSSSSSSEQSPPPDVICFNAAISVCKRAGQRNKALQAFDSMKKRGVIPNTKSFLKVTNLCAKEPPLYEKAIELIGYMEECNLPLNPHCVSSAISACGRAGQLELAMDLLRLVEEQHEHGAGGSDDGRMMLGCCFKAAIVACERCGATNSALALKDQLRAMSSDIVEPTTHENNIKSVVESSELLLLQSSLNKEIVVDAPIGKMGSRRRVMGILSEPQGGRAARTYVTPLAFDGTLSLNSVVIETGRTHQIRVHMASVLGCPLVGDPMYNNNSDDPPIKRAERCMLHATELRVPHPTTGAMIRISCPPPPDFSALVDIITCAGGDSSLVNAQ
ncbi:hypothetical protein ACHAXR_006913, partial [Thalassiosira sp. AJA248-18]